MSHFLSVLFNEENEIYFTVLLKASIYINMYIHANLSLLCVYGFLLEHKQIWGIHMAIQ